MYQKKYTIKYYYTYNDLIEMTGLSLTLANIYKLGYNGATYTFESKAQDIFERACVKYADWFFISSDEEIEFTSDEITNVASTKLYDLARRLVDWYLSNYNYYNSMLTYYNDLSSKLLDKINSVVGVVANSNSYDDEAPQVKTVDGEDIFSKSHANFYNYGDSAQTTTSNQDTMYNFQKLKELRNNMLNLEDEWATTLEDYILTWER